MRRPLKWIALAALVTPLHLVVILAITGVPKPPAITAEDVGRVGWSGLLDNAEQVWSGRQSKWLATWMPDGSGVLMGGARILLDSRLHVLAGPGAEPVFIPGLPRNATPHSALGRDYMVLAWDRDGDEQTRLYRWDLGDTEPVALTSETGRAIFGAFEPHGHRIAYSSTQRNGTDFDLYLMDPRDPGSEARVLEVEGTWGAVGWSPTEDEILVQRVVSNVENELSVLDVDTRSLRPITESLEGTAHYGTPRWSRDGTALYYSSNRGTEFAHLRRLDLVTGEERILSDEIPWDVSSVQLTGDGERLLVVVNEDGRTVHYTTDPFGLTFEVLDLFPTGQFSARLHPQEPLLLVNHVDPRGVGRGYTYDLDTGTLTLWAGVEPSDVDTPSPRLIHYPTFDDVDGAPRLIPAFVYPGVGDGPRPVLISIHGGPEAQARLRTGQGATQRDGITLITPNVRGSTGYGRTYASLDDQYLREDAVRDIGALLDWIEEQPDLDASRVAVTGGSYGGYMVLASLVHYSSRLGCGIDIVGVSNFVTFLENTAPYRRDLRRAEYGDERIPEMREFLESISPLNNAERITSRLMVVQGANDPRVPVGESRQLVERVRGNGLDVSYMEGENEGHGFRHPWNALWSSLAQQDLIRECLLED